MTYYIYGRTVCPWCDRAKALLEERNIEYEFLNIETNPAYLSRFKELFPTKRTVPQIRRETKAGHVTDIGGYEDLYNYLKTNS